MKYSPYNYYTARVSSRIDPNSPKDQNTYLNALKTIQNCHIHFGSFQVTEKVMFLVQPVIFQPPSIVAASPTPRYARVVKTEEKGSDVNLGAHLVRDAFKGKFEHAAILTNDTDLAEPIRIVVQEANLPVTLLSPVSKPAGTLQALATSTRRIESYLGVSQFSEILLDSKNRTIQKPVNW